MPPSAKTGRALGVEWISKLGEGGFGKVHKARNIKTGELCAVKSIDLAAMGKHGAERFNLEVELQQAIGYHIHIVQVIKSCTDKKNNMAWIVMELCEGGDLQQVVEEHWKKGTSLDENTIWMYFAQIVCAVRQLHSPELRDGDQADPRVIAHRDLKLSNIFLDKNHYHLKIGDFGLARDIPDDQWAHSHVGTLCYMAPEVLADESCDRFYDERVDVFAMGVILQELCTLEQPFLASNRDKVIRNIKDGKARPIPSHYSAEIRALCAAMLNQEPEKRPTLEYLFNHPEVQCGIAAFISHLAEDKVVELKTQVKSLEERMAQQAQESAALEAKIQSLTATIENKNANHTTIVGSLEEKIKSLSATIENQNANHRTLVDSLKDQLQCEQNSTKQRTFELEEREHALRAQERACDRRSFDIERQQKANERLKSSLVSQQQLFEKKQLRQEEKKKQLETRAKELFERERGLVQRERRIAREDMIRSRMVFTVPAAIIRSKAEDLPSSGDPVSKQSSVAAASTATRTLRTVGRINVTRALPETKVSIASLGACEDEPIRHSTHLANTAHQDLLVTSHLAILEPVEERTTPCAVSSASPRKIRSAGDLERKKRITISLAKEEENKWTAEDIGKTTSQVVVASKMLSSTDAQLDAPSEIEAKPPISVAPRRFPRVIATTIMTQPPRAQVSDSKGRYRRGDAPAVTVVANSKE